MRREAAWRVFAGEFNDSTIEIKGEGDMAPSYVVTPLGAKINRLFVIGVLTDVESISEGGDLVRAHISDPTGVFTLYSGNYQQDITDALNNIDAPAFVAVVGKTRTYTPDDGGMYVSIRPENVIEVSSTIRDKWIIETCKNTKDRIEAMFEAAKMKEDANINSLRKLGFSKELSEGILLAIKNYGDINLNKYIEIIQESLQYLTPGKEEASKPEKKKDEVKSKEDKKTEGGTQAKEKTKKSEKKEGKDNDDDFAEIENNVLNIIKENEGEEGASWDDITEKCEKTGLDKDTIEEALTSLMDKGLIYEPVLGTLKTT